MTEDKTAQASQEEATGQEQDSEPTQSQQSQQQVEKEREETREASSVDELPEWARSEIKSLRTENAKRRKQEKQREDAEKTELQSMTEERDALKTENENLQGRVRRSAFIEVIGVPSPALAYNSISELDIEPDWDENDRLKNADALRKALKKQFPREFGDGSADGGQTTRTKNGYQGPPGKGRLEYAYGQKND